MSVVTDTDVEKALDFLRNNAFAAAKARAERIYLEEFRKSKKAILMKEAAAKHNGPNDLAIGAQERDAYASEEYQTLLLGLKAAVENDEKCRFGALSAQAVIDAWRTQQANERTMGKIV
jgi:predicted Zn-dependent peptidase